MPLLSSTSTTYKVKNLGLPGYPVSHCHSVELGMVANYNESAEKLTAIGSIFRQGSEWVDPQLHFTSITSEDEYSFNSTTEKSNTTSFVAAAVSMVTPSLTRTGNYQFQGKLSFTTFERGYEVIEALQNNFDGEVNADTKYAKNMKSVLKSNMDKNIVVVLGFYQGYFQCTKNRSTSLGVGLGFVDIGFGTWGAISTRATDQVQHNNEVAFVHLAKFRAGVKILPSPGCLVSG